ncbi:MAG: helix-turn-helix domain-containing protein [Flavisolibacter sp.]
MIAREILPSPSLKEYIQHYRLRHFVFSTGVQPPPKPFPPRPEQCLSFYVRGCETVCYANGATYQKPRSVLSGQFTGRANRYVSYPEVLMIIVDFKPGALYRLTNIPFTEFTDKDLDAETVFSPGLRSVNDRLNSSASYDEMIRIIEDYFMQLVQQSKKEFSVLDQVLIQSIKEPAVCIDQLVQSVFLSPRQLERKFNERIGISPKLFLRICRFNNSYWMHLKNPKMSWFDIAMSCGYTDYQHLAKEYKAFTGTTPNHFFVEERSAPGRILELTK